MTIRKLAKMLFAINGMQFLLCIGILAGLWKDVFQQADFVLDLAMGLMLLSSLLSIGGLFSVTRYQNQSYRESMQNLENLNSRLREQRHDYLNQIQIVYGLLELGEYEDARDYMRPVFKDIMKVNRALKTAQPAVNALLQAKMETAEKQGIDFYLEVGTQLSDLAMEPWELCKVLGNLIDNAVTAVSGLPGERRISLDMREAKEFYQIAVRNNGPEIPEQHRKQIFNQGFTTKKEEGHGMGLAIVASVLKEAKGGIRFESDHNETVFIVTVPKAVRKPLSFPRAKMTR
ncbi:MAG: Spo0B domain-containing protein [Eubacteriales bacterium]|nr:Spo0B domain-containing protein [Eubacteriales bacterium]